MLNTKLKNGKYIAFELAPGAGAPNDGNWGFGTKNKQGWIKWIKIQEIKFTVFNSSDHFQIDKIQVIKNKVIKFKVVKIQLI